VLHDAGNEVRKLVDRIDNLDVRIGALLFEPQLPARDGGCGQQEALRGLLCVPCAPAPPARWRSRCG
jgi:hypothetical protein